MGVFSEVYVPAFPVFAKLRRRGMPLDTACRARLRVETVLRLAKAERETGKLAQDFHVQRIERIKAAIAGLEDRLGEEMLLARSCRRAGLQIGCEKHPEYLGLTKRAKCPGCANRYERSAGLRATIKDYKGRIRKGKAIIKRIGPFFQVGNDHHWRELLFEPVKDGGLGLTAVAWTDVNRLAQVDDEAIEKLMVKHPEVELLQLRVASKQSEARLTRRLGMLHQDDGSWAPNPKYEPNASGRMRFAYALHRSTGRVSSGADEIEEDKSIESPGNGQNIPEEDRVMYVADPGMRLLARDWSQIEARVVAWLAREIEMLRMWVRGEDIHARNALTFWKTLAELGLWKGEMPSLARVDAAKFLFQGKHRTFRYANKRSTHGRNYAMQPRKESDRFGLPLRVVEALHRAYWEEWARIKAWQEETFQKVCRQRWLANSWGKKLWAHNWAKRKGLWVVADREEFIAFVPQVDVVMMCLTCLPDVERIFAGAGGELFTTTHDSYLGQVPDDDSIAEVTMSMLARTMEREWRKLGQIPGHEEEFGWFTCPTDGEWGYNWGPWSDENPKGMRKE